MFVKHWKSIGAIVAIAIFTVKPAIAQYGGLDTTAKDANTTANTAPTVKTITPKRTLHPIQKEAMTFLWTNNSNVLVNNIANGLQQELEPNFGNVGNSLLTAKPTTIGYQYHFRDRWTMGIKYTWAEVTSDTLAYPDFDRINQYAYFQYVVKLNSF
ncbi:MAG: hypothetical protein EBT60_10330, partial [Bacteroidetes bacterium]|nr:hypothetical protein [Bacteroidota bacterium]